MKRTTVFADERLLQSVEAIARQEGRSLAATVRLALEEFVGRRRVVGALPSFVAMGRSGNRDISTRAEDLLWTPPRRNRRR
jgi:putative antitoxin of VapBC-like toxin-antitoxin system